MKRRFLLMFMAVTAFCASAIAPAAGQGFDIAHSDEKLRALGLAEVNVTVGPDGVEAPATLEAGTYLFELNSAPGFVAYLDIMVPPAGLDDETALQQALDAASNDLALPTWQYWGGGNTFEEGVPSVWAMTLQPGEYVYAASYYEPTPDGEEVMELVPLTVTASAASSVAASPVASPVAALPEADVTLEMTDDLQYIVSPDPVATGPQLWEITNTGTHHAHHVVMWQAPEGTTSEDIIADFNSAFAGTPPAEDSLLTSMSYVGYAALQSGGATTLSEFDFDPGTYAIICYIIDPETGRPHFADGMVTVFTVAE